MKFGWIGLFLLWAGCTRVPSPPSSASRLRTDIDWQGHRGARGLAPENTLAAFRVAVDLGVPTLELDLVVSRDSQLIVSHEPWFSPEICQTPSGAVLPEAPPVLIYSLTAAQIRTYDCGSLRHPRFPEQQNLFQYKPTLVEVVDSMRSYCRSKGIPEPNWNIETKHTHEWETQGWVPPADVFAQLVHREIDRLNLRKRATVQSFSPATLEALHRRDPAIACCLLVENTADLSANLSRLSFRPQIYSPYYPLVTPEMIVACHEQGIQVIPWTVNEISEMERLVRMGVDGLISDYPDRFAQLAEFKKPAP